MERLTQIELAARHFARSIDREFRNEGVELSDAELARWVRQRLPVIPEHIALAQIAAVRQGS